MNKPTAKEGFVKNAEPLNEPAPAAVEPDGNVVDIESGAPLDEPVKEIWPVTVRLMHKPVRNNKGDMVKELTFREPTGGDINRYGNPCHVDQNGDVVILERKMTTMMAVLSGVLQPFLEGMDPRDWNSCAYRLRGFFIPDPAAW
jgi:hypothetical protein